MSNGDWLQAQYSVLGSVLLWPELAPKVLHETSASDFNGPCRTVYEAMEKLHETGEPIDPVSVNAALDGKYDAFLRQLMEIVPSSANIDHYIQLCREQARVVTVRGLAQQITLAESSGDIRKLLEQAHGLMVDKPSLQIWSMADGLNDFYQQQGNQAEYLSWPVRSLNERLYAVPGSFIVIGGAPSTGKSAWALQCASHFAQRYKVGFFSLETSRQILFARKMTSVPELTMDDIKRRTISCDGWNAVARESTKIIKTDLDLISAAGMSPADIRSVTMMKGYEIIFVDYLQILHGMGSNRAEQVTGISMALHTMAQSMGVTVIALSQLKRKDNYSASPSMSDLRESGQIEQDADIIMILQLEDESEPDGPRGLYIAKNKEGTCFKTKLHFDGKHQVFSTSPPRVKQSAPAEQFSLLPDDYAVPFEEKG